MTDNLVHLPPRLRVLAPCDSEPTCKQSLQVQIHDPWKRCIQDVRTLLYRAEYHSAGGDYREADKLYAKAKARIEAMYEPEEPNIT